jgi:hypothetical protein
MLFLVTITMGIGGLLSEVDAPTEVVFLAGVVDVEGLLFVLGDA